ncbi:DNA mismatch repair endonuclease MutL [Halobellus salinus]|uniref:DNA mismatch repair endonuclease MutL n=1 Tax=Halobellus salinus TaxID=931585 RepID=UPI00166ECE25|nr:DNA mismatch repair endonuclease MutL [Halobellus salinus]
MRELDDRTVTQIAAGEVVERPASVVKELVENSLDAGADRLSVAVEAGGTEGIRVRDDGVGMDRAAVERAVEEHTTSKIDTIDDLEAGVGTLGFRGEALHTIGAVSRVTIRTKPRGGDTGTELRVEGGEVTAVGPAGCPEGTVVAVEDLFYNTPARRKFLKTTPTEFDHVNTVVTHYALANPDVAISLEHDDREVFATEGRGDLRSAVLSVYGREVAEAMRRVDGGNGEADGEGVSPDASPVESISGLVSHPETTRSTRDYLSTFVNGRYVTAGVLRKAVLDAYGGQLAPDRYPFAVLFVDLPADSVDVNVHPRKMEVRLNAEAAVTRAVTDAVREALLAEGLIRSGAPRGRSAPAETEIDPESPDSDVRGGAGHGGTDGSASGREATGRGTVGDDADTADTRADDSGSGPPVEGSAADSDPAAGVASDDDSPGDSPDDSGDARTVDPESDGAWTVSSSGSGSAPAAGDRRDRSAESGAGLGSRQHGRSGGAVRSDADTDSAHSSVDVDADADVDADSDTGPARERGHPSETTTGIVGPTVQRDLTGDAATLDPDFDSLPSMRVLGRLHDTYVVAETDSGLVLIDQHAADERVNYERLQNELSGGVTTQALAESVDVELTAREAAAFSAYRDALAELGFRTDRIDDRTVAVRSVPAVFASALDPELLREVLSAFVSEGNDGGESAVASVTDELLADLACYPSVTGNTSLTEGSVVDLLEALDGCTNPYACPHGRPVVVSVDADEIESRFERDYPGHGGRREA